MTSSKLNTSLTANELTNHFQRTRLNALVIGFPERGGGADVGTLQIVHFKVLVFPHPWGIYFLQSPQYLEKPSTQLASELYFGSFNT